MCKYMVKVRDLSMTYGMMQKATCCERMPSVRIHFQEVTVLKGKPTIVEPTVTPRMRLSLSFKDTGMTVMFTE